MATPKPLVAELASMRAYVREMEQTLRALEIDREKSRAEALELRDACERLASDARSEANANAKAMTVNMNMTASLDRRARALEDAEQKLERRIASVADELASREVRVGKSEGRVAALERELEGRRVENETLDREIAEKRAILKTIEDDARDAHVRAQEAQKEERGAKSRARAAERELELALERGRERERDGERMERAIDAMEKELETMTSERNAMRESEERRRKEIEEREAETASVAERVANECEAVAAAWEEVEHARASLDRQERAVEDTANELEKNVEQFERDVKDARAREEALESRAEALDAREEFLKRIAKEGERREVAIRNAEVSAEATMRDVQARGRELDARETLVAGWETKMNEAAAKEKETNAKLEDILIREGKVRDAQSEVDGLLARERELEEKEMQLEHREEEVARQLGAAAESELALREERAKLDERMESAAPMLHASELKEEIDALKTELELAKARANAAIATAALERRRAEEAEAYATTTTRASTSNDEIISALERALDSERVKYESAMREMSDLKERAVDDDRARAVEVEFAAKSSALLRANALLDARESELVERETVIGEEMERLESETLRLERLHAEFSERVEQAMNTQTSSSSSGDDDEEAIKNELELARSSRLEAEQLREAARAHLMAAAATVEAAKAVNVAFEAGEKHNVQMMKRVSAVVAAALAAAHQEGDALRAQREALALQAQSRARGKRNMDYDVVDAKKVDALEAQLEYVTRAKSELDRREAALRSVEFAKSSHARSVRVIENSISNVAARADAQRLRDDVRRAAGRLREYLAQGESRLARAERVLSPGDVAKLRLALTGLVGVAKRLEGDDTEAEADERLAERLKALEREIRRTGVWFEDLAVVVSAASTPATTKTP